MTNCRLDINFIYIFVFCLLPFDLKIRHLQLSVGFLNCYNSKFPFKQWMLCNMCHVELSSVCRDDLGHDSAAWTGLHKPFKRFAPLISVTMFYSLSPDYSCSCISFGFSTRSLNLGPFLLHS